MRTTNIKKVIIGARSSTLSKLQAITVGEALNQKFPEIVIEYAFRETKGDLDQTTALPDFGGQSVFTKDLEEDLYAKKIDLIVHSWKDMDLGERKNSKVFSVLKRKDPRDVLLFKKTSIDAHNRPIQILTSSPRRAHQLLSFLPQYLPIQLQSLGFEVHSVRGNVPTRLEKCSSSQADGIVIAKAALDRLLSEQIPKSIREEVLQTQESIRKQLLNYFFMVLPLSICPTAPAQGALAVQILEENEELESLVKQITDRSTEECCLAERSALKMFGGGCHQKIGVTFLKRSYGTIQFLSGLKEDNVYTKENQILGTKELSFQREEVWPPGAKMAQRQRERLTYKIPPDSDLFVSRGYAFPLDLRTIPDKELVWTAGLGTWRELASRGIWVHGSVDGLGEQEPIDVRLLLGRTPRFIKLSHLESDSAFGQYSLISTYKLSSPEIPFPFDPNKIKAAFWRSGTEYSIVTNRFPILKRVIHFSGPGSTHQKIKNDLKDDLDAQIYVSLSFDDWVERHIKK
ncbi:porphobilinogen deaminase [Leptospira ryugenii]|uniref:Hydroxymethylbilane synthase n=1 Tax=Leptospira ryugenii TaxID=1917863 RepID=A0A2P2DVE1_9LEPT|nr:hydroxymethylbilane synthase [Leptospira ryugenii]GBF48609.1 porphobilinogen deaminase [Leptospira ryugenii]